MSIVGNKGITSSPAGWSQHGMVTTLMSQMSKKSKEIAYFFAFARNISAFALVAAGRLLHLASVIFDVFLINLIRDRM